LSKRWSFHEKKSSIYVEHIPNDVEFRVLEFEPFLNNCIPLPFAFQNPLIPSKGNPSQVVEDSNSPSLVMWKIETTSPLRFRAVVVLNPVPLPGFHNIHVILSQVPSYTAILVTSDDRVFAFDIRKSTESTNIITLCDTNYMFDEMTFSGTWYFSTINCYLDFKQWHLGTSKALVSGFPIINLRVILLEGNTLLIRMVNGIVFLILSVVTSSGKNYCLVSPWPRDGWLLLDHFGAHKPYFGLPPTGLVHHMTYKPLWKLIFLKLRVSSFIVHLNHMFVHFFVRWIHITPTLSVASIQTEKLVTFFSYYLATNYTIYVTQFLLESCNRDHYFIMIAKVSENSYLKLIIVLNGMTFLYGYRHT